MKKWEELTPEQQKKLKEVNKKYLLGSIWGSLRFTVQLTVANIVVALLNQYFVRSAAFGLVGGLVNFFVCYRSLSQYGKDLRDRTSLEAKQILENNN